MAIELYDYADDKEGTVLRRSWGSCRSATCRHVSHDPYFEYYVTVIDGDVIWRGEQGESLVCSSSGRCFFTMYRSRGPNYAPEMITHELAVGADNRPILDEDLWDLLVWWYGGAHHRALRALSEVVIMPGEPR